jgi:hypothetical protein
MWIKTLLYGLCLWGLTTNSVAQNRLYVFMDVECPISQIYTKRLTDLFCQYGNAVTFEAVYPMQGIDTKAIESFKIEYNFKITYTIDTTRILVEKYQITTIPEVIVLNEQNEIVYRGAIDNQFVALGIARPKPDAFYVKDAIEALLNHRFIKISKTKAIGCLIGKKI